MINTVAPFWDGNETWLVLGGGGLWVAFPRAYAVLMPAMYLPIILMLLSLVFRGVAFEFRTVARTSKRWWDIAFWLGATLAAFFQGVTLGGLIQGITVKDGAFAGGPLDWATPFAAMTGLGVVGRLRAARRHLAGDEDRRPGRRPRPRAGQDADSGGARLHGASSASGRRSRSTASPRAGSRCRTFCSCGRCRCDRGCRRLARLEVAERGP